MKLILDRYWFMNASEYEKTQILVWLGARNINVFDVKHIQFVRGKVLVIELLTHKEGGRFLDETGEPAKVIHSFPREDWPLEIPA